MKAERMFKEIGYEKVVDNEKYIIFETLADKIWFDKRYKTVGKIEICGNNNDIDGEELEAINQMFYELGWNDRKRNDNDYGVGDNVPITTYSRLRSEIKELRQENDDLKEKLQLSRESRMHLFVDDDMLIEQNKKLKEEINILMKKIEEQDRRG